MPSVTTFYELQFKNWPKIQYNYFSLYRRGRKGDSHNFSGDVYAHKNFRFQFWGSLRDAAFNFRGVANCNVTSPEKLSYVLWSTNGKNRTVLHSSRFDFRFAVVQLVPVDQRTWVMGVMKRWTMNRPNRL